MGYENVPWYKLTWWLLWLYTGLTILVMLKREDFLNMTICTAAMYMLFNRQRITKTLFRILVLGIFISLIYDLCWFFLKHSEFSTEQKADGGMENNIRKIVLMLSYMAFLLKVTFFFYNHIFFSYFQQLSFGKILWISERLFKTKRQQYFYHRRRRRILNLKIKIFT